MGQNRSRTVGHISGNVAGDSLSENWKAREQADDEKENRCRPQNLAALHGAPLFAYLESKLNCVLQKLSRKICSRYGRHHLNDEKHPCTFRTGKGGNPGRSVTYRTGHDSGLPRWTARQRISPPQIIIGASHPFHSPAMAGNPYFSEVRRLPCPDRMLAESARRELSGLAKALSGSHLRWCDSRAACHFDHWGSIQENRWKTAIPGAGQFQAMSFAASFRRKSGLC